MIMAKWLALLIIKADAWIPNKLEKENLMDNKSEILIYQTPAGSTKIDVRLQNETVWLSQYQLADLFQTDRTSVAKHIKNIYENGELMEESTCAKIAQVQNEGGRSVSRNILYYNLDVIISVGYRVQSHVATHFRIWATQRLKEYLIKGFTLNDDLLKDGGKGNYFEERCWTSMQPVLTMIQKQN